MAGSYKHCVDEDGRLLDSFELAGMLENGGDVWEAVEELYGMVWLLANGGASGNLAPERVENARLRYREGVQFAEQLAKRGELRRDR